MKVRSLFIFLLFAGGFSAKGQEWDFLSWHKVQIGGELVKNFSLSVEQQLRLENNSSSVDETFTQIGLGYKLTKGLQLEAAYRFSWSQTTDGTFRNRHRYNIDLNYGKKFGEFKAKLRARFQHRPSPSLFNERLKPEDSPIFVRLKLSLSYRKLKKWTPGLAFETFIRVDDPNQNGARKFRYRVFLNRDLPKRQNLRVFYMLQTDHFGKTPKFLSVVGVSYSYEWKRPKRKKKEGA
ncbi:MAG: DUF2490 domain-containing protein [Flavobacteriales bacterium]|nr:DUF2490 domain-containing protein [Flavobacteriales bacterium]